MSETSNWLAKLEVVASDNYEKPRNYQFGLNGATIEEFFKEITDFASNLTKNDNKITFYHPKYVNSNIKVFFFLSKNKNTNEKNNKKKITKKQRTKELHWKHRNN